jgi:hypothetical protein
VCATFCPERPSSRALGVRRHHDIHSSRATSHPAPGSRPPSTSTATRSRRRKDLGSSTRVARRALIVQQGGLLRAKGDPVAVLGQMVKRLVNAHDPGIMGRASELTESPAPVLEKPVAHTALALSVSTAGNIAPPSGYRERCCSRQHRPSGRRHRTVRSAPRAAPVAVFSRRRAGLRVAWLGPRDGGFRDAG